MKQTIYNIRVFHTDLQIEVTAPKDEREAFKNTLATGHAVAIVLRFSEEAAGMDDLAGAARPLLAQGMLAAGVVSKIVRTGDRFEKSGLYVHTNLPIFLDMTFGDESFIDYELMTNHSLKLGDLTIDEVYNPKGYSLPMELCEVEYIDNTYDSRDKYRRMPDEELRDIVYDNKRILEKYELVASRYIRPKRRLWLTKYYRRMAERINKIGDAAWEALIERQNVVGRIDSVMKERRRPILRDLFYPFKWNHMPPWEPEDDSPTLFDELFD